ncbi:phytanoyl-CoA dioxygenase family protein [Candidatus Poribacteria bacterium]|nr:phytanoyl-CoA dioxygenase family protein [Candidatus Poribacteria bacterium]
METTNGDLLASYQKDGYLTGIHIADDSQATYFRNEYNALENEVGAEKCEIGLIDWHFDYKFIWELAIHENIVNVIEELIGPDVMLLATHFFCKYGPKEKFVAWHQDVTYWGLEPPEAVTAWYAIDDSDTGNGCMQVIPGSHHKGIQEHGKSEQKGNLLSINQEVSVTEKEENTAVDLVLKAGEMSIHHGQIIHGSLPNHSKRRRCGLTIRYISPSVKQAEDNSLKRPWKPILLRGEDRHKNFDIVPNPFPY